MKIGIKKWINGRNVLVNANDKNSLEWVLFEHCIDSFSKNKHDVSSNVVFNSLKNRSRLELLLYAHGVCFIEYVELD